MNARQNTPSRDITTAPESLYRSALLLCDPAAVPRPRRWQHRAKLLLLDCIATAPRLPEAHALLAYIECLKDNYAQAEASIRKAVRFDTNNRVYLRLLLDILLVEEKIIAASRWLHKLAAVEGFDIADLKARLRASKLPTDTRTLALNAFPNALGWFESQLSDDAERLRRGAHDGPAKDSEFEQEAGRYRFERLDAKRVPAHLRSLIPIALDWGTGEDAIRDMLLKQASKAQAARLRRALSITVRRQINAWLDSFASEFAMSDEAACFMYLLLAYEEIQD